MAAETIDLSEYDAKLTELWGAEYPFSPAFEEWWNRMEREARPTGYRVADLTSMIAVKKQESSPKSPYFRPW